jgi:RsiW-degrading membrane proteinase PrsW (M82 family)
VRCGAPLARALANASQRREFAAAPGQNRYVPWLVSTLFPRLPRHSDRHFQAALVGGVVLVAILGALRLFPVALITAALLMPLATLLYFYDVDVYERMPIRLMAATILWGAAAGTATGALAKAVAPSGVALLDKSSTGHVLTGGILIPALGVILMLAGPLALLRNPELNDALDGANFGSASAVTFAAAEAVVVGAGVLGGGLRPPGAAAPWVERLLAIAVATPVLTMSAIGAAGAAFWLRYRSPSPDKRALGILGQPLVAVAAAAALVIAGAVSETFMSAGTWLATLVVLDLIGLLLLRRALHIGLLEEAAEREIGPELRCANCGAMTVSHTFCGNCGVATHALPKSRETREEESGAFAGRLGVGAGGPRFALRWVVAWVLALAAVVGVAFAVGSAAAPSAPKPRCQPGLPCAGPPVVASAAFAFPGYTLWQSSHFGYSLRYDPQDWSVGQNGASGVELDAADGFSLLLVVAGPSSNISPAAAVADEVSTLEGQLLGVTRDTRSAHQLLGPNVGLVPGPGAVYTGTIASPQGPQTPVSIAIVAASSGGLTIRATVVTPGNNSRDQQAVFQRADDVINSIQYP